MTVWTLFVHQLMKEISSSRQFPPVTWKIYSDSQTLGGRYAWKNVVGWCFQVKSL